MLSNDKDGELNDQALSCLRLPAFNVVKKSENTIVLETEDNFIKIYQENEEDPRCLFKQIVLSAFADEHKKMGIEWEFETHQNDTGGVCFVERREKLHVLTKSDATLEHAIKMSAKVTRQVERKLGFPQLTAQVSQKMNIDSFTRACLARHSLASLDDYASKDGKIISLGTSNMFLALINDNDEHRWLSSLPQIVEQVVLKCGNFIFAPKNMFENEDEIAGKLLKPVSRWWCFSEDISGIEEVRNSLFNSMEEMFSANVRILSSKTSQPVRVENDFHEERFLDACRRLSCVDAQGKEKVLEG